MGRNNYYFGWKIKSELDGGKYMSCYHIYQTDAEYRFLWWDMVKDKFNIDDYHKVYSGVLVDSITYGDKTSTCNEDDDKVLEELFEMFNIKHPEDYKARSLSVSDVVVIVRADVTRYYYCDNLGWKLILSEPNENNK